MREHIKHFGMAGNILIRGIVYAYA